MAGRNFDVIFTTACSGYAQQAIDTACLHYLNKPVDALKLGQAMERF